MITKKTRNPSEYLRYVARVSYDGTRFRGFQDLTKSNNAHDSNSNTKGSQPNTIQGILKKVLSERFSTKVSVIGASRTDAGVHSRGQAIHFDIERNKEILNIPNFEFTLNRVLPEDIRLYNVTLAPPGTPEQVLDEELWHATKSNIGKIYSYTFCTNKYVDPLLRRYCGHMYFPVDIPLLEKSLKLFEGTHDFSAFSNQVDSKKNEFAKKNMSFSTIKTIYSIDLIRLKGPYGYDSSSISSVDSNSYYHTSKGPTSNNLPHSISSSFSSDSGYYRIDFYLNSALYRMIRNIVWACAYTAGGMMKYDELKSLLNPEIPYFPVTPPTTNTLSLRDSILTKKHLHSTITNIHDTNNELSNDIIGNCLPISQSVENIPSDDFKLPILPIRCKNIAKPAPPEGLCLERVIYHNY